MDIAGNDCAILSACTELLGGGAVEENYRQVKARIRTLEAEAERLRRQELQIILVDMRQKIKEYGIKPDHLFGPDLSDLVRYRHPETGQTWNGIGRPPNWIRGKDRHAFSVE